MRASVPAARNVEKCEWALAACLMVWFACTTLPHAWGAINSDFPNYYITAHLVRDHSSTSRIYEWIWFQRQKDHLEIARSFSAMPPLTPFSTLFLWPFAWLAPLSAKHCWLVLNAGLLAAVLWMMQRSTGLRWSRIALLIAASYPLERNLLNGQYYILLLFFLTLGLWLHLRGNRFLAGTAIAVAIGLKLFPLLFVLYFLRKRDWRALAGSVVGGIGVLAVSVAAFGWQLHRLYLLQVLPRGLRGESTGPYNLTSASFTVLFHRLFIYEPSLNPHPAIHAAWLFPVLLPIMQFLVVAPLLLLINSRLKAPKQIQLEWAAVLLACLALSPLPASYHFVLLFLPMTILLQSFIEEEAWGKLGGLVLLFLAIGFPAWPTQSGDAWLPLLHVPRLYAMLALYVMALMELRAQKGPARRLAMQDAIWMGALACMTAISVTLGLRQRTPDAEYVGRLDVRSQSALLAQPLAARGRVAFISMERGGYRALQEGESPEAGRGDELSEAVSDGRRWVEGAAGTSRIEASDGGSIENAEQPVVSSDGKWMAFLREDHGRGTLWLRTLDGSRPDEAMTLPEFDVLESTFAPNGGLVFAAFRPAGVARLYERSAAGEVTRISDEEARYPAVSPDGKWLAYSVLVRGSWNLRLRDRSTGRIETLTRAACNAVEPAWESDSRTLLFASDCGRAIGQTALYRRQVVR
jgi:hypothetical protein